MNIVPNTLYRCGAAQCFIFYCFTNPMYRMKPVEGNIYQPTSGETLAFQFFERYLTKLYFALFSYLIEA